jgi:putative chitinase
MTLDFTLIRSKLFGGALTQSQVDGLNALMTTFDNNVVVDKRFRAYMMATTYHETGREMQPIEEWGKGLGQPYAPLWYGRGYVQLTWQYNYVRMTPIAGVDLVKNPAAALEPEPAGLILIYGMTHGSFTGKKLADYFTATSANPVNARRIINGTDCAAEIASYYQIFMTALGE